MTVTVAVGVRDRTGRDGTGTAAVVLLGLDSRAAELGAALAAAAVAERYDIDLAPEGATAQIYHAARERNAATPADGASPDAAAELVEQARRYTRAAAETVLEPLITAARDAGHRVIGIALPTEPPGPEVLDYPLADVLASHSLVHAAEAELYRDALATAAAAQGLPVSRYASRGALDAAAAAFGVGEADVAAATTELGRRLGRPWRREHREAAAAALTLLAAAPGPR